MKKNILILFVMLLGICNSYAQYDVKGKSNTISDRVNSLKYAANQIVETNPDRAIQIATEGLNLLKSYSRSLLVGELKTIIGNAYTQKNQFDRSLDFLEEAYLNFEEINNQEGLIRCMISLSEVNRKIGYTDKALGYSLSASRRIRTISDSSLIGLSKLELGKCYYQIKKYKESSDLLDNALQIFGALKYFNKEQESFLWKGMAQRELGNYNASKHFFSYISDKIDKKSKLYGRYLHENGSLLIQLGDIPGAITDISRSIELSKENDWQYEKAIAQSDLGIALISSKKYTQAYSTLDECLKYFEKIDAKGMRAKVYQLMADLAFLMNDPVSSYKWHQIYDKLRDSIYNYFSIERINQLQVEFGLEQVANKMAILDNTTKMKDAELETQNNYTYVISIISILLLLAFLTVLLNFRKNQALNKQLKIVNMELENKNEELIKSQMSLRESNAIKDKFYSIIAHDIRNPLNPISVGIEVLKQRYELNIDAEKQSKIINDLSDATKVLAELLENLLQWTNVHRGKMFFKPAKFDLADVVNSSIHLLNENIKQKQIVLFSDIAQETYVMGDMNMIGIVMRNLLSNAIKFSNKGGIIKISAVMKESFYEISIIDTGVGMNQEIVDKLFDSDSFHTTEGTNYEKGTGLGLKLCKEFIDLHECTISCKSRENSGSTFKFTLPIGH